MKLPQRVALTTLLFIQAVACPIPSAGEPTINPTGRWTVTLLNTNAQVRPTAQTLKLKLDGDTLTGTLSYNSGPVVNGKAPVSELPITAAKLQGNEISFRFTHNDTGPRHNQYQP